MASPEQHSPKSTPPPGGESSVGCPAASPHPAKSIPSVQGENEPPFSRGREVRTPRQEGWAPGQGWALLTFRRWDRGEGGVMEKQSLESWGLPGWARVGGSLCPRVPLRLSPTEAMVQVLGWR